MALRVLLHAPTADALARARSNARNLFAAAPDATCEIVVNAAAVASALEAPDAETDPMLRVCENTLRRTGQSAPDHIIRVTAAVLHIAQRQAEGWQYIRA